MNHAKKLLIIEEDIQVITEVKQRLESSQQLEVCGEVTRADTVWQSIQTIQPDLVLLGSIAGVELGFLAQQIRFYFPNLVCIVACSTRELHWEPFLRSIGVCVVGKPIHPRQLELLANQVMAPPVPTIAGGAFPTSSTMLETKHEPISRQRMDNKVFLTIYGPKGGVGKTFLSRELAVFLSQQKRDGRPLKVLAVDFNLDLGTIATSLNLPRTPNIFTWVQGIEQQLTALAARDGRDPSTVTHTEWQEYSSMLRLSPEEVQQYVVVHPETSLHVLTSPREIRQSFEIKDYHLYIILETLKQSDYDVILIDTAPDTMDATIQALFFAHRVVMVGNPVVDSIENIHRMLKLLREAEYPEERIQLCMNRLQRKEMFTIEEIRAYFQLHPSKTIYTIPDDQEVKRSINTGVALALYPGKSPAKEAIEQLAKALVPLEQERSDTIPKQKMGSRLSILGWLRK